VRFAGSLTRTRARFDGWFARRAFLHFLLLGCMAAGCHRAPYTWVHELRQQPEAPPAQVIQTGDLVEVRVFGQDSLNTQKKVRADGTLTVPLVGQVVVKGARPSDVAANLTERLRPFVNDPRVSVIVHEAPVTVAAVGEVGQVGLLELEAPATVLQALAKAGGLSEFANRSRIFVLRSAANNTQRIRFTYHSLLEGDAAALAFHMRTGDVLVVE
jgi:polysaccharide export outer membrane protein